MKTKFKTYNGFYKVWLYISDTERLMCYVFAQNVRYIYIDSPTIQILNKNGIWVLKKRYDDMSSFDFDWKTPIKKVVFDNIIIENR